MRPRLEDKILTLFTGALIGACLFTTRISHGAVLSHVETVRPGTDILSLVGVSNLTVSPDNKHLYATSFVPPSAGAVSVFAIDEATGKLSFVEAEQQGVNNVSGLNGAAAVAVSDDGAHVYVGGGFFNGVIAVFARDPSSGALNFLQSLVLDGSAPQRPLLERVYSVDFGPNGDDVYAVANSGAAGVGDAVLVFRRDPVSGSLTFVEQQRDGIAGVSGLGNPSGLAVSGDGKHVLVTGNPQAGLGTFTVFDRDPSTGKLKFNNVFQNGSAGAFSLSDTAGVLASFNDRHAYVSSSGEAALYRFDRAADGFAFGNRVATDAGLTGLAGAVDLLQASGGSHLVTAARTSRAVTLLRRDPFAGDVNQVEVLSNDALTDPSSVGGLAGAGRLASAFAGRYIFVPPLVALGDGDSYVTVLQAVTADLAVALTGQDAVLAPGSPAEVSFNVSNVGATVANNAILYVDLQGEGELVQATTSNPEVICSLNGKRATCALGAMASAAAVTFDLAVIAAQPTEPEPADLLLSAQVAADEFDPNTSDNAVSAALTVVENNEPPVAQDDNVNTLPDTPLNIDVLVGDSDPDSDVLNVTLPIATSAQQGNVSVDASSMVLYVPPIGFKGRDSFSYEINDGRGGSARATVFVAVNTPPQAQDDVATGAPNAAVDIDVAANDQDADGHSLSVVAIDMSGATGTAEISGGLVRYTPAADSRTTDQFSYTIEDELGGQATAQVTVTPNRAPVAQDDEVPAVRGEAVVIDVLANDEDPDGDPIRVAEFDSSAVTDGGQIALDDEGRVTFTPAPSFAGAVEFGYVVEDDFGGRANATVRIVYNTLPVAVDDTASTVAGKDVAILVLFNDKELDVDDSIEIFMDQTSAISRENGTIELAAVDFGGATPQPALLYTPAAGFTGFDEFTYAVRDMHGAVATAKVVVDVKSSTSSSEPLPPASSGGGPAAPGANSSGGGGGALFGLLALLAGARIARSRWLAPTRQ